MTDRSPGCRSGSSPSTPTATRTAAQRDAFLAEVPARGVTDLVVFSHGWNNDRGSRPSCTSGSSACSPGSCPRAAARAASGWPAWCGRRSGGPTSRSRTSLAGRRGGRAAAPRRGERRRAPRRRPTRPWTRRRSPTSARCSRRRPRRWTRWPQLLAGPADRRGAGGVPRLPRRVLPAGARRRRAATTARATRPARTCARRAADAPRRPRRSCSSGTATRCAAERRRRSAARRRRDGRASATRFDGLLARRQGGAAAGDVLADEEPGGHRRARGLGPLLGRLHAPAVRVHLVGHSFGARLVSLRAGRAARPDPSPVQVGDAAAGRLLALRVREPAAVRRRPQRRAGRHARPDRRAARRLLLRARRRGGPVLPAGVVRRPGGLGRRRRTPSSRWGGIGANGAQGVGATLEAIRPAGPASLRVRAGSRC